MRSEDLEFIVQQRLNPARATRLDFKRSLYTAASSSSTTPTVVLPNPTQGFLRCWDLLSCNFPNIAPSGDTFLSWSRPGWSFSVILVHHKTTFLASLDYVPLISGILGASGAVATAVLFGAEPQIWDTQDTISVISAFGAANVFVLYGSYWDIPYEISASR